MSRETIQQHIQYTAKHSDSDIKRLLYLVFVTAERFWLGFVGHYSIRRNNVVISSSDSQSIGPGFDLQQRSTCQGPTKSAILSGSATGISLFWLFLKDPHL